MRNACRETETETGYELPATPIHRISVYSVFFFFFTLITTPFPVRNLNLLILLLIRVMKVHVKQLT